MDEDFKRELPPTQAERIISKFGGPRRLAELMHRNPSTIYRWLYPIENGGTGGLIPAQSLRLVLRVAREQGIFISAQDLYPGRA